MDLKNKTNDFMENFPRRGRLDLNTPTELTIRKAMDSVEELGAGIKLTQAGIKLQEALDLVADYVDENLKTEL